MKYDGLGKPPLAAIIAIACLAGCAGGHPATVADFRDFLLVRGPLAEPALVGTFFEVGLGDAILLELPSGSSLLMSKALSGSISIRFIRGPVITSGALSPPWVCRS